MELDITILGRFIVEPPRGACVLLATREQPGADVVRRAIGLAEHLDLPIDIVRVLRSQGAGWDGSHTRRIMSRFVEVARHSTRFYRELLGSYFADERLSVRVGEFKEQIQLHADDVQPAVIVLPAGELRGTEVTALARITRLPVFVAHSERGDSSKIVAATDLATREYPVLARAHVLGRLLQARVVAVHHVPRTLARRALTALRGDRRAVSDARARDNELERVRGGFGADDAVLLRGDDCAKAIVDQAEREDADTIVVGTHLRPSLSRVVRKGVAASIVDQARRSVLVEPLEEVTEGA